MVNNGWRGSQGRLVRGNSRDRWVRETVLLTSSVSPLTTRYLSNTNMQYTDAMYMSKNTAYMYPDTHIQREEESQLPFQTAWCVNKHPRAFQPNKTNFQSSTNSTGPIVTPAFGFFFFWGTAQLICHHKSWPQDSAKISAPLQPSSLERVHKLLTLE